MSYLNFTTQQLQGGGKYSVKSKIGNWYEDMVNDEIKYMPPNLDSKTISTKKKIICS